MEIYFVRHGETSGNVAHRHQAEDSQLTLRGEAQAAAVAKEIKALNPTHLVSSNMVRALSTAKKISVECGLTPDTSTNLIELTRPDYLYGKYLKSPASMWYAIKWYLGKDTNGGESYADLRARVQRARVELEEYPDDASVVVVSHAVFIIFFLMHMCKEGRLSIFEAFGALGKILKIKNTSITPLLYDPVDHGDNSCAWQHVKS